MNKEDLIKKFWSCIDTMNLDELTEVAHHDCIIYFPNTNEKFVSLNNYIEMNKVYPGRWHVSELEIFKSDNHYLSICRIFSEKLSFYNTGIFRFKNNKIVEWREYWSPNSIPVKWRIESNFTTENK